MSRRIYNPGPPKGVPRPAPPAPPPEISRANRTDKPEFVELSLLEENAKLAAYQCPTAYAAEGGHLGCRKIDELQKEVERLNKLVQRYKRFAEAATQYVDTLEKLIGD